jgi:hypothetical protein
LLLIGSRAAGLHLPGFRKPMDWDFLAREKDLRLFSALEPVGDHSGPKRDFRFGRTYVEVELASPGSSAESLLAESDGTTDTPWGTAGVASVDALLLLKKSHIAFPRMWPKHFKDYKVLQAAAGCVPKRLEPVLAARVDETKRRLRFRERNFSVSNDEFFGRSADRVFRAVPHDSIHEVVKFGDLPVFKMLKEDQGVADVSYRLFLDLPFALKVANYREECMVLTVERYAVPARVRGDRFAERLCAESVLRAMCFNYLPFDFRAFCVDYFDEILAGIPRGFASRAMDALGVVGPSIVRS